MDEPKHGVELFYSCGGHGGPYWSLAEARERADAMLRGKPTMSWVDLVERTPCAVGGYGRILERIKQPA